MNQYLQPQSPWRQLPTDLPMVPWYSRLMTGQQLPTWQGPSNLRYPSAQYWGRMTPSERYGFQGMAETMGVYWPDYYQQMSRLWPRWNMPSNIRWRPAWW